MPSTSPAQAKLMAAVAHGWHKPGGGGPPVSVAKEFNQADKGTTMNKGYQSKTESFAQGGAVLGKESKFLKTENRFLGRKLPEHGEAEETEDRFEKGSVNATTPAPAAKGKSLKAIVPKGS